MKKDYIGVIIEESLRDSRILNKLFITGVKITNEENPRDRWHMYDVIVSREEMDILQKEMDAGKWYMNFDNGFVMVVVYRDRIFEYNLGDKDGRERAVEFGRSLGIPEKQLDF